MNVSIERDTEDKQILAIYIRVNEGEVYRTVEVAEGACYVDEDKDGNLLGVEVLAPGNLEIYVPEVGQRYKADPKIEDILKQAMDTVNIG